MSAKKTGSNKVKDKSALSSATLDSRTCLTNISLKQNNRKTVICACEQAENAERKKNGLRISAVKASRKADREVATDAQTGRKLSPSITCQQF